MIDQTRIALWVLAVTANATALQRLYAAWERFQHDEPISPGQRGDEENAT